jgi:hypothetical protein
VTVRVTVDLNVRVRGNQAYSTVEDADGPVAVGDKVLAVEQETGVWADATVTEVDGARGLVYLAVDWGSFRDDPDTSEDPACE